MFGIGYQEMFVVLVVAMVIFGPSRLPELAGQVGRWVRDFRRMSSDLTGEFSSTFQEIDEVKKSFERELKSAAGELEGSAKGTAKKPAVAKTPTTAKTAAASGSKISTRSIGAKTTDTAAKPKMPALDRTKGAAGKNGNANNILLATKEDPLVDVSLFEIDFVAPRTSRNGTVVLVETDAMARVRRRRASGYGRRAGGTAAVVPDAVASA